MTRRHAWVLEQLSNCLHQDPVIIPFTSIWLGVGGKCGGLHTVHGAGTRLLYYIVYFIKMLLIKTRFHVLLGRDRFKIIS